MQLVSSIKIKMANNDKLFCTCRCTVKLQPTSLWAKVCWMPALSKVQKAFVKRSQWLMFFSIGCMETLSKELTASPSVKADTYKTSVALGLLYKVCFNLLVFILIYLFISCSVLLELYSRSHQCSSSVRCHHTSTTSL